MGIKTVDEQREDERPIFDLREEIIYELKVECRTKEEEELHSEMLLDSIRDVIESNSDFKKRFDEEWEKNRGFNRETPEKIKLIEELDFRLKERGWLE